MSQSYRKIDGYEDIFFVSNDKIYKRTFGGLKRVDGDTLNLKEENVPDEGYEKLRAIVGDEYYIEQYVFSPDESKILYEEVHPWGAGAPTDDEDIYYDVSVRKRLPT